MSRRRGSHPESHLLASLPSTTTAPVPLATSMSASPSPSSALLGDKQHYRDDDGDHLDGDDGWEAERPPLQRDYLDDDNLGTRLAAQVPWLKPVAQWRPYSRRARSLVVLAVGLATLVGIIGTTAAAGHGREVVDGPGGAPSWRHKLSSVAQGVSGWLWRAEEPWRRPHLVERNPNVSFADYLADLSFVPFPVPASTSSLLLTSSTTNVTSSRPDSHTLVNQRLSTTALPHPSYSTTDERNVVLLTMCDGRYVHAVRIWALRARDLGMHRDNVVVLCLDQACLDEAEKHGLHAYGGFAKESYASKVPPIGRGQEAPDVPPIEIASSPAAAAVVAARTLDKREGKNGGIERGSFMQYTKFRVLYEINAAGYAALFFEADTALTDNPFAWMRPLGPTHPPDLAPANLTMDLRRRMPSPFALPRAHAAAAPSSAASSSSSVTASSTTAEQAAAAAASSASSVVDPEGLDPGWDMLMTQDGYHVANFGFFLMRPTIATTLFWRSTLRQYVARVGWDQAVVHKSIGEHGWTQQWLPGWWEEGALARDEAVTPAPKGIEEQNKYEQWHLVDKLDGLRDGERLRINMLPLSQFYAYHILFFHWKPLQTAPDPVLHHMTTISYQMRNFWPKERGWYSDIDGYYSRPRPLLVPWNVTHEPEVAIAETETAPDLAANRTFWTRDEPDYAASTLTGTADDLLHYARILQLLGGVSTSAPRSNSSAQADLADDSRWSAGSIESFAVKLPGKMHILQGGRVIVQDSTRLLDLDAAVRASVDVVEPAFFKHAAAFLSAPDRDTWTSTRLRISLAAFDSLPALVAHLREVLAPYVGSAAEHFGPRGVVVELTDWSATLTWKLDDLNAGERAPGMDKDAFEALKASKRCMRWGEAKIPFLWCKPE